MVLNLQFKQVPVWEQYPYQQAISGVCEVQFRQALIRQPLSTLSNVLFLWFGIEALFIGLKGKQAGGFLARTPMYSLVFGICLLFLFAASTLYHASLLKLFSAMDLTGVFACALLPIWFGIHRLARAKRLPLSNAMAMVLFVASVAVSSIIGQQELGFYMLPLYVSMAIVLVLWFEYQYAVESQKAWWWIIVPFGAASGAMFMLDRYYCDPQSYIQLHSIWHVCAALSAYAFYRYLLSSKETVITVP